ncbi:hypothetical protein ROJ8625_04048 [Roseivivax jejudonensis]|uniref:Uncharacterized protein n=1 Tax=Roseivivax jejudonensis TaxID=1529041 RepID=A0A1X7AAM6_9RHOB|nr:hypothetical protein [Roseivivax jejudonensis]SLN74372.1 hypothetical protein ROJ8625_04048 [Roseivivax jejudonensis]
MTAGPRRALTGLSAGALLLAGCATFPEIDAAESADVATAPYPDLVPIGTLLAQQPPRATPALEAEVTARADALRARADALRGPVIDAPTRDRLSRGVRADAPQAAEG